MHSFIQFFLHLDQHLAALVSQYGVWTYAILAAIVFAETGLVVTPFLPGDSLLFAAGALAATTPGFSVHVLWPLLVVAVFLGDNVNYFLGSRIGRKVFKPNARILKTEYLHRTEAFYEKYGGRAVVLARFIPIVRTYAPFVAGASKMPYHRFLTFSIGGSLLWITLFLYGGYFFGNLPWVKKNFEVVVIAIILVSVAPAVVEMIKAKRAKRLI